MDSVAFSKLVDVLTEIIGSCRAHAGDRRIAPATRTRLTESAENVEFFLQRRDCRRATSEAWIAAAALRQVDRELNRLPSGR